MTSSQTAERRPPVTRDLAAGRIDVRTEQDVAAPPAAVWAALLDRRWPAGRAQTSSTVGRIIGRRR